MKPYVLVALQQQQREGNFGSARMKPPNWVLDKIADEKLSGGFKKKNGICNKCFQIKTVNGNCGCE